jgi:hypothetical protein
MAIDEPARRRAGCPVAADPAQLFSDATIRATALNESALLVTLNLEGVLCDDPGIGVAYVV